MSTRFSRPVRTSSTAANCPVRLIAPRTSVGPRSPRRGRRPWRCRRPACSSVARMRTRVVLPAPFAPEQREMVPALDLEVDPAQDVDVLEGLPRGLAPGSWTGVVVVPVLRLLDRAGTGRWSSRRRRRSLSIQSWRVVGCARYVSANSTGSSPTIARTDVPSARSLPESREVPNICHEHVTVGDACPSYMKYRSMPCAAVRYGAGRASMPGLVLQYCRFCSRDPVRASIHLLPCSTLLVRAAVFW